MRDAVSRSSRKIRHVTSYRSRSSLFRRLTSAVSIPPIQSASVMNISFFSFSCRSAYARNASFPAFMPPCGCEKAKYRLKCLSFSVRNRISAAAQSQTRGAAALPTARDRRRSRDRLCRSYRGSAPRSYCTDRRSSLRRHRIRRYRY